MAITTDAQALGLVSLLKELSNTDIVPVGSDLFENFGNQVEEYFSNIDDDSKKANFFKSVGSAGKQIGSISPSDYEELVGKMIDIFALSSETEGKTMLSVLQDIQRTDILDPDEVVNYVEIFKILFA